MVKDRRERRSLSSSLHQIYHAIVISLFLLLGLYLYVISAENIAISVVSSVIFAIIAICANTWRSFHTKNARFFLFSFGYLVFGTIFSVWPFLQYQYGVPEPPYWAVVLFGQVMSLSLVGLFYVIDENHTRVYKHVLFPSVVFIFFVSILRLVDRPALFSTLGLTFADTYVMLAVQTLLILVLALEVSYSVMNYSISHYAFLSLAFNLVQYLTGNHPDIFWNYMSGIMDAQSLIHKSSVGFTLCFIFSIFISVNPLSQDVEGMFEKGGDRLSLGFSAEFILVSLPLILLLLGRFPGQHGALILGIGFLIAIAAVVFRVRTIKNNVQSTSKSIYNSASTDLLTGLTNRLGLFRFIKKLDTAGCTIWFIDLNEFKPINDNYGHSVGDKVLQVTAERISSLLESEDCVARYGGDEFIVIRPGYDEDNTPVLTARLRQEISKPIIIDDDLEIEINAAIGTATTKDGQLPSEALSAADKLMYDEKERTKAGRRSSR